MNVWIDDGSVERYCEAFMAAVKRRARWQAWVDAGAPELQAMSKRNQTRKKGHGPRRKARKRTR